MEPANKEVKHLPIFRKPKTAEVILEGVKALIEAFEQKPITPSLFNSTTKRIAEEVLKVPLKERGKIAEQIEEHFKEKIEFHEKWEKREKRKLKNILEDMNIRIKAGEKIDPVEIRHVKEIDLRVKRYRAKIYAIKALQDRIIHVVIEGKTPDEIWGWLIEINQIFMDYYEAEKELWEEYQMTVSEGLETETLNDLLREYSVKKEIPEVEEVEKREIENETVKELMEKYLKREKEE